MKPSIEELLILAKNTDFNRDPEALIKRLKEREAIFAENERTSRVDSAWLERRYTI